MFLDLSSRVLCETTVSLKSLYILRILWLILLLHYNRMKSLIFIFKSDLGTLYFYIQSRTKHGKNCEERKTTSPIYIQHHRILTAVERKEKNQLRNKMKKIKPRTDCRNKVFSLDNYGKQMVNIFFTRSTLKYSICLIQPKSKLKNDLFPPWKPIDLHP